MIKAMRCRTISSPAQIALMLNWYVHCRADRKYAPSEDLALSLMLPKAAALGPCLAIPYLDPFGEPSGYCRLRPDVPRMDHRGKSIKYESPVGEPNRPYIPFGMYEYVYHRFGPLLLVEGEKKAASAVDHGFSAVGIAGVWSWCRKKERKDDFRKLLPDLAAIPAVDLTDPLNPGPNRLIVPVFDSDCGGNEMIQLALAELCKCLRGKAFDVKPFMIPQRMADEIGIEKAGLDDVLAYFGREKGKEWLLDSLRREVSRAVGFNLNSNCDSYIEIKSDCPAPSTAEIAGALTERDAYLFREKLQCEERIEQAKRRMPDASPEEQARLLHLVEQLENYGREVCPEQKMRLLRDKDVTVDCKRITGAPILGARLITTCRRNNCRPCFPRNVEKRSKEITGDASPFRFYHAPARLAFARSVYTLTINGVGIWGACPGDLVDELLPRIAKAKGFDVDESTIKIARSIVLGVDDPDLFGKKFFVPIARREGPLYLLQMAIQEYGCRVDAITAQVRKKGDGYRAVLHPDYVTLVTNLPSLKGSARLSVDEGIALFNKALYEVPFLGPQKGKRHRFHVSSRSWQTPPRRSKWKFLTLGMDHVKDRHIREILERSGLPYKVKDYTDGEPHPDDPHIKSWLSVKFPPSWPMELIDNFMLYLAIGKEPPGAPRGLNEAEFADFYEEAELE